MAGFNLTKHSELSEASVSRRMHKTQGGANPQARGRWRAHTIGFTETPSRRNARWFFVALVGGGIGVWTIKSVVTNPWVPAFVAAGVVITLALYYVLNDENAPEEEGDNVYYLGLLFTLISLMFSILQLFGTDSGGERNEENIRALLENFGIALTSTIVGIAGRVAVQNWQRGEEAAVSQTIPGPQASPEDLEKFNRHLLSRIARDLTQGATALARFHRIVRRYASDSEANLRVHGETLKEQSAAFQSALQSQAETFAQNLKRQTETILKSVVGSFGAAATETSLFIQRVSDAHEKMSEMLDNLKSGLDDAGTAGTTFAKRTEEAAKSAVILGTEIDKLRNNLATMEQVSEKLRTIAVDGTAAAKEAENATDRFGELEDSLSETKEETQRVTEALRGFFLEVNSGTESLRQGQGAGTTFVKSTEEAAESAVILGTEIDKLRSNLATVEQVGEKLRTITVDGSAAAKEAEIATDSFGALQHSLSETKEEAERATKVLRIFFREVNAGTESLRQSQGPSQRNWKRLRFWKGFR